MTFWEHLEALRYHLLRSVVAVFVFMIVAFLNRELIFDQIILAPKTASFITNRGLCWLSELISSPALCIGNMQLQIINIQLSGQFLMHMYISLAAGLILAVPYVLWELWRFLLPALTPSEKRYSRGAVFMASLLFILGVAFSYYLIVPLTINFLGSYQVSATVVNQISLTSYVSTVITLTFAVGLIFELPILVYFLTRIGIVTPELMQKNRKYMLVLVLVFSAIITPADVFSQVMVAIPLYLLYELSIKISKRVLADKQANTKNE